MQLYGKICSLFLLLAFCSVALSVIAPNIKICPDFEEFSFSFDCEPTCAEPICDNTVITSTSDKCTCMAGFIRETSNGKCIRATSCP